MTPNKINWKNYLPPMKIDQPGLGDGFQERRESECCPVSFVGSLIERLGGSLGWFSLIGVFWGSRTGSK